MRPAKSVSPEPGSNHERFIPHVPQITRAEADPHSQREGGPAAGESRASRADRASSRPRSRALEDFSAMAAHELLKPLILAEATAAIVLDRTASRLDLRLPGRPQADDARVGPGAADGRGAAGRLAAGRLVAPARARRPGARRRATAWTCWGRTSTPRAHGSWSTRCRSSTATARCSTAPSATWSPTRSSTARAPTRRSASAIAREGTAGRSPWTATAARSRRASGRSSSTRGGAGRTSAARKGAGLGLAIVRRIVERHGGEVGVLPLNGRGNRFYFTLPAA